MVSKKAQVTTGGPETTPGELVEGLEEGDVLESISKVEDEAKNVMKRFGKGRNPWGSVTGFITAVAILSFYLLFPNAVALIGSACSGMAGIIPMNITIFLWILVPGGVYIFYQKRYGSYQQPGMSALMESSFQLIFAVVGFFLACMAGSSLAPLIIPAVVLIPALYNLVFSVKERKQISGLDAGRKDSIFYKFLPKKYARFLLHSIKNAREAAEKVKDPVLKEYFELVDKDLELLATDLAETSSITIINKTIKNLNESIDKFKHISDIQKESLSKFNALSEEEKKDKEKVTKILNDHITELDKLVGKEGNYFERLSDVYKNLTDLLIDFSKFRKRELKKEYRLLKEVYTEEGGLKLLKEFKIENYATKKEIEMIQDSSFIHKLKRVLRKERRGAKEEKTKYEDIQKNIDITKAKTIVNEQIDMIKKLIGSNINYTKITKILSPDIFDQLTIFSNKILFIFNVIGEIIRENATDVHNDFSLTRHKERSLINDLINYIDSNKKKDIEETLKGGKKS